MRRILRTQDLGRMRIEGNHNRRSILGMGMSRGSRNDRLMSEMDTVERADGEEERAGQVRQVGNGMKDFHQRNDPPSPRLRRGRRMTSGGNDE